jgi:hypothetical protein
MHLQLASIDGEYYARDKRTSTVYLHTIASFTELCRSNKFDLILWISIQFHDLLVGRTETYCIGFPDLY